MVLNTTKILKISEGKKYSYNILLGHFKSIFTYIDINGNF